jgi:hypothetical protein
LTRANRRIRRPLVSNLDVFIRTLTAGSIFLLLSVPALLPQDVPAAQPYDDTDAYEIYSLLLPHEESYSFAGETLMIQETTVAEHVLGACLKNSDAKRFKGAIEGYNRIYDKNWRLQRQFKISKSYKLVGANVISALPDRPETAVSYVTLSPVGFNRDRTQAIVFASSSCGGFCGSWRFHILEKVHGKWNEARVAMCSGAL